MTNTPSPDAPPKRQRVRHDPHVLIPCAAALIFCFLRSISTLSDLPHGRRVSDLEFLLAHGEQTRVASALEDPDGGESQKERQTRTVSPKSSAELRIYGGKQYHREQAQAQLPKHQKNITVFYHTFANPNKVHFVPKEGRRQSAAVNPAVMSSNQTRSVVMEQLHQVNAAARELGDDSYHWALRFFSVGEEGVLQESWVNAQCQHYPGLQCHFAGHHSGGHEEVTLQQMHDYCHDHPDDIVVYIHTKGTFHATTQNNQWRKLLTVAAMKASCIRALEENTCNVCGLQYYPIWISFFPGNMFSASCDYVRKLVDVTEHANQMSSIVNNVVGSPDVWARHMYPWQRDGLAIDRWSREAWIGSHPDLVPCDMARYNTRVYQIVKRRKGWEDVGAAEVSLAPRTAISQGRWARFKRKKFFEAVENGADQRPHEYFLLPGHLYRFYKLYGEFPAHDSWIWDWFPHGREWRHKVEHLPTGWNESILF